jgi:cytochrome P450
MSRAAILADRWALYADLRDHQPVHWSADLGSWILVRHVDVLAALRSPDLVTSHPLRSSRQIFGRTALDADGAAHRDLRRMVAWFTQDDNTRYHVLIDEAIEAVLDAIAPARDVDLVTSVAERIPARVIAAVLGLRPDDGELLYQRLGPVFAHIDDPRHSLMAALDAYDDVATTVADTAFSADGVASALAQGLRQRAVPTPPAVRRQVLLMLAAGTRTTTAAIANTLSAVVRHPGAYEQLENPLWRSLVVAESLRWRPSLHFTLRYTTAEYQVAGQTLPAGAPVQLVLAAANHDERVFPQPAAWIPTRNGERSLTFGGGRHVCAGSLLATAEMERLLAGLHQRFASLTPTGPTADEGLTFVMPRRLPVRMAAR